MYSQQEKAVVQASYVIASVLQTLFVFLYYIVTASVVGTVIMPLVASLIIIKNILSNIKAVAYVLEIKNDIRLGLLDKITSFAGIAYLITFFILFFT